MNLRRVLPTAAIAVVGAGALLSFQSTPGTPAPKSAAAIVIPHSAPATTAPPPPTTTTPASGSSPAPTTPATTPSATTPPASTPPASTPPTVANTVRTLTGDAFDARYGLLQVQVTMRGKTITDVTELQAPNSHQRSIEINQQAEPLLRQEALQAQSAQIDIVSGATYTSQAYAQSLQSALDQAHG